MAFCGVNAVCRQCVFECKQFEQVTLTNCPKFKARKGKILDTSSFDETIGQVQKKRGTIKRILRDVEKRKRDSRRSGKTRGLCPVCKKRTATSRHHIKPLDKGGEDTKRNTVYLCKRCRTTVEDYTERGKPYSPILIELIKLNELS